MWCSQWKKKTDLQNWFRKNAEVKTFHVSALCGSHAKICHHHWACEIVLIDLTDYYLEHISFWVGKCLAVFTSISMMDSASYFRSKISDGSI